MGKRPDHVKPPAYLAENPPIPDPAESSVPRREASDRPDPTRYGDWEKNGIAVDF